MITVEEASRIIFENLFIPTTVSVDVSEAVGKILAEPVEADRDFPPFNRVSMDGIAILHDAWSQGRRTYGIAGNQAAGERAKSLSDPSACLEVMTGAVLPSGCDAVIRYEDVEIRDGMAEVRCDVVRQWQSVHLQGIDARKGEVILSPGQRLASSEIALLASVGKARVKVRAFPGIAIVSTGDELIDIADTPEPWQIRRSNSYAIQAALRESGAAAACFHLADDVTIMEQGLRQILSEHDVLILSGGVSKGKYDFVPRVLEAVGIRKLFHQVSQRPGKPFWFGASDDGKIAFALPGNPVSTFMCFYKYILPWMTRSMGTSEKSLEAVLAAEFAFEPPLTCFLQVSVTSEGGRLLARPLPGGGSGDFANLKNVDGFLELPLEKSAFRVGEVFPYIPFRH